jgi:hypothetical protein
MTAQLLVELGPCDDNAYLYVNSRNVLSVGLDDVRRFQRELQDGAYNMRLRVANSGAWAWRVTFRLTINGVEQVAVNQSGNSVFYAGDVYDEEWQFSIVDGQLKEFITVGR